MTKTDFINKAVGLPWVRWGSDWNGCDCYGLIVLYYREVLGISLPDVPKKSLAEGLAEIVHQWEEVLEDEPPEAFISFVDSEPAHVGLYIGHNLVLHAQGSPDNTGSTRVTALKIMRRTFGDVKFYRLKTECL